MQQITSRDLHNLLGAIALLNEDLDLATLPQRTVAAVEAIVPTDMVTYNEVDLRRRSDRILVSPDEPRLTAGTDEYAAFIRHIDEHPVIAHNAYVADPIPRKISDFLTDRRFRSLGLHFEFFRTFDINYQMTLVMHHAGEQMIGIAANRAVSDFTERERSCLTLLRRHVVQAYRNGLKVERFRAASVEPGSARQASGLTRRETEVLHWVAHGKSNGDVARIIGTTSATVKKHLEHIYAKLGVQNRTAATTRYLQPGRT